MSPAEADKALAACKTWQFVDDYYASFGAFTYTRKAGDLIDDYSMIHKLLLKGAPIVPSNNAARFLTCSHCGTINKVPEVKANAAVGSGQSERPKAPGLSDPGAVSAKR